MLTSPCTLCHTDTLSKPLSSVQAAQNFSQVTHVAIHMQHVSQPHSESFLERCLCIQHLALDKPEAPLVWHLPSGDLKVTKAVKQQAARPTAACTHLLYRYTLVRLKLVGRSLGRPCGCRHTGACFTKSHCSACNAEALHLAGQRGDDQSPCDFEILLCLPLVWLVSAAAQASGLSAELFFSRM